MVIPEADRRNIRNGYGFGIGTALAAVTVASVVGAVKAIFAYEGAVVGAQTGSLIGATIGGPVGATVGGVTGAIVGIAGGVIA